MTLRSIYVELGLKVQGFQAGIATSRQAVKGFTSDLDKLAATHKEKFDNLTNKTGLLGAGLVGAVGLMARVGADFEHQMSAVDAVVTASAADMDQLRQAAIKAGAATSFSATEAAQAEEELAKANISVKDILGGGLAGALSLAAAGTIDVADAATIAAQAMKIFGLRGAAVPHIADVLAAGANKSATDVHGLGEALSQAGLIASQAGLSFEDTVGTLAAFGDRALVGSDAGTSLKTMLQALSAPSGKSAALMKSLGISAYDTSGKFVGITKLAGQLQEKLGGLAQADRDAAMATIFGSDATRAATVLYSLGSKGIDDYITSVDDAGAAQRAAGEKTDNLVGDLERLKGTISSIAIDSTSGTNDGLRALTKTVDGAAQAFEGMPSGIQSTITVLGGVTGVALLATSGFLKARQSFADFSQTLVDMGPRGEAAAKGLGKATKALGYLGVAAAAAGLTIEGYQLLFKLEGLEIQSATTSASVDEMTRSLKEFARTGIAGGKLASTYGADLHQLGDEFERVGSLTREMKLAQGQGFLVRNNDLIAQQELAMAMLKDNVDLLDTSLANLVNNGNAAAASIALQQMATQAGIPLSQLLAMMPKYATATAQAAVANTGLAQGFAAVGSAGDPLKRLMGDLITEGLTFTDVWNSAHGAVLAVDTAMLSANQAIEEVGSSLKGTKDELIRNGQAFSGNSDAALKNRIAMELAAKKAAEVAQATYQQATAAGREGDAVEEATTAYDAYIAKLKAKLISEGVSKKQADELIAAYAKMPALVATRVTTPGLTAAQAHLQEMLDKLDRLPNSKTVNVHFNADWNDFRAGERNRFGGVYEKAAVGTVREAAYYPSTNPGRYMIAEPGTGGELFVPKHGIYGRSMSLLQRGASWYGASVVPNTWMAAPQRMSLSSPAPAAGMSRAEAAQISAAFRAALSGATVLLDGRQVGRLQADRASILQRGS